MKTIRHQDYAVMPWKNGRGTTREIFRVGHQGAPAWRLSLAEVTTDGPFSRFPGFERVLTVVTGDGMRLVGPGIDLAADRYCPVRFSGDVDITGYCRGASIENFNLIFNPDCVSAQVRILTGPAPADLSCGEDMTLAVHVLRGAAAFTGNDALNTGDTGILCPGERLIPVAPDLQCAVARLVNRA